MTRARDAAPGLSRVAGQLAGAAGRMLRARAMGGALDATQPHATAECLFIPRPVAPTRPALCAVVFLLLFCGIYVVERVVLL